MTALVKYEAARAALQAAHDVDEVKDIRDKAQAMALYAKQANDTALVEWATEIKVRAERRAGQMLADSKINGARHDGKSHLKTGPESHDTTPGPTLESIGVSRDQSSRWQRLAAIPEKQFEEAVATAKGKDGEVTTAALLRAAKPTTPPPEQKQTEERKPTGDSEKLAAALKAEQEAHAETREKLHELGDVARELEDKLSMFEATEPDDQQKLVADLQAKLRVKDAEIYRQRGQISDLNNKCNALIKQVKIERKKNG